MRLSLSHLSESCPEGRVGPHVWCCPVRLQLGVANANGCVVRAWRATQLRAILRRPDRPETARRACVDERPVLGADATGAAAPRYGLPELLCRSRELSHVP